MAAPFGDTAVPVKYQPAVLAAATRYGVSPAFLAAQINAESGFNPTAVSPSGAIGIAQFMPGTAKSVGVDPHDPIASINAMAKLMAHYKSQFGTWEKALYAYHDGPGAVNSPGPAGIKYAKGILDKVGGALSDTGSEGSSTTPAGLLSDPFTSVEKLGAAFTDSAKWKRVGLYAAGFLLLAIGVFFFVGSSKLLDVGKLAGKAIPHGVKEGNG